MFTPDLVLGGSLLILAGWGQPVCEPDAPARINVVPRTLEIQYDTSRSLKNIQSVQSTTVNPYGFHEMSVTQGFMQGAIKISPSVSIKHKSWPAIGAACLWYEEINVEIEIDPTIVIAKEVYKDRCMRDAVLAHEKKHINIDRKIVNEFANTVGKKLYSNLKSRGFKSGIVKADVVEDVATRMQKAVYEVIEHEYKRMELNRIDRQRALDSRTEYDRVSAQCPNFKMDERDFR